jgi:hypothetical protein
LSRMALWSSWTWGQKNHMVGFFDQNSQLKKPCFLVVLPTHKLPTYLPTQPPTYINVRPTYLPIHTLIYIHVLFTYPLVYLYILPTHLFAYLLTHPPTYLFTHHKYLPTYLHTSYSCSDVSNKHVKLKN